MTASECNKIAKQTHAYDDFYNVKQFSLRLYITQDTKQMEMRIDINYCRLLNDDYWRQLQFINHHHNIQLVILM